MNLHLYGQLAVPLEQVQAIFARYGLLDEQTIFIKGLFQDTLPSLNAGPFALIRHDGDLYESTSVALDALYPKLTGRVYHLGRFQFSSGLPTSSFGLSLSIWNHGNDAPSRLVRQLVAKAVTFLSSGLMKAKRKAIMDTFTHFDGDITEGGASLARSGLTLA